MDEWQKVELPKAKLAWRLIRMVPVFWRKPSLLSRRKVIRTLEPFANANESHLKQFALAGSTCPHLMAQVLSFLMMMANEGAVGTDPSSDEVLERRMFEFFAKNSLDLGYEDHRLKFFHLFIRESIDPMRVLALVKNRPEYSYFNGDFLATCLESDVPLLCAWYANHVFWMRIP
ncbi:MAG: hypothetical protein U1D30_18730 [Planctomycetota bacterium]